MLSEVIHSRHSYRAVPLAGQLVHQRSVHSGPLVTFLPCFQECRLYLHPSPIKTGGRMLAYYKHKPVFFKKTFQHYASPSPDISSEEQVVTGSNLKFYAIRFLFSFFYSHSFHFVSLK